MIILGHEHTIATALQQVPPSRIDDARKYIESRLRPWLHQPSDDDVRQVCTEAIDRYAVRQRT